MATTIRQALTRLKADVQLRGFSESTRHAYVRQTERFLEQAGKHIEELCEADVRKYLGGLIAGGKHLPQTINMYNAAIRFFFEVTLGRKLNHKQIPRMKTPKKLPIILSREEVEQFVSTIDNLKHRALILTAYGSGLRVSELISLKVGDIDSKAMRLFVRDGKGGKDRYTLLSEASLVALRDYWRRYRPKSPQGYIFPGVKNVGHISDSAVGKAIDEAVVRACITKSVTPHTLRHCFATHLLGDGVGLLQIKELLGHSSIHSTTIYLHLANTTAGVVSPADKLNLPDPEPFEDYSL